MPRIRQATPLSEPLSNVSQERIEYPSADGKWNLVYHTPREWHMCAEGWQARLFHGWRNVTAHHKGVLRIAGQKGFRGEAGFQPWSCDSTVLVFVTWDEQPVFLYDVAARKVTHVDCHRQFIAAAQFAPDMDRLLITSAADGLLVDQTGDECGIVPWDIAPGEGPHTFWMKSGRCFFLLAPAAARARTALTFFRGEDGSFADACDLDPSDVVPYDAEQYAELPRNRFCLTLVNPPGVRAVGSLLDRWSDVRFDRASGTLFLSVLRPISQPHREGDELVCNVAQRWVAVELTE